MVQTADAADAGKVKKSVQPGATPSKATPQVADAADAVIRNKSVEFVRYIAGTRIPVLRHRTFSKLKKAKEEVGRTSWLKTARTSALANSRPSSYPDEPLHPVNGSR